MVRWVGGYPHWWAKQVLRTMRAGMERAHSQLVPFFGTTFKEGHHATTWSANSTRCRYRLANRTLPVRGRTSRLALAALAALARLGLAQPWVGQVPEPSVDQHGGRPAKLLGTRHSDRPEASDHVRLVSRPLAIPAECSGVHVVCEGRDVW